LDNSFHTFSITSNPVNSVQTAASLGTAPDSLKILEFIGALAKNKILERVGIKYISSAHIVIDACLTGSIEKEQALLMLDKLRISISDNVIEKAKDVILKWK
jgi:hypothetical protein